MRGEPGDLLARHRARTAVELFPFGLDLTRELRRRQFLDQNLDPRLVDVVAPAVPVVDAQDRVEIVEQLGCRKEISDHVPDHRRAALAATDDDPEARPAGCVAHRLRADVVDQPRRAVDRRAGDRDLELARQERELRVQRRPTARNLLINRVRRERIIPIEAVADLDALEIAKDEPDAERTLAARDELRRLQSALDRLPPRCREAVILGRIEALPRREIAARMGIAEDTVTEHLAKGMRALADILYGDPADVRRKP